MSPGRRTGTRRSKQRLRLWLALLGATRSVEGELRERIRREFDGTLPRFDVLAALHRADGARTMTELSRFLMVSNGNVTGIVARLVADGLVLREVGAGDRRRALVRLTARGRRTFEKMAAAHERWVDELLDPIDQAQATELGAVLARFRAERNGESP